jgi:type I restriction enzyme M protein
MFEQAFKNIDDVLRKEAGCTTELDYTEQTSWLLFLKYLDGLEEDRAMEAELEDRKYAFILDAPSLGELGGTQGQGRQARP